MPSIWNDWYSNKYTTNSTDSGYTSETTSGCDLSGLSPNISALRPSTRFEWCNVQLSTFTSLQQSHTLDYENTLLRINCSQNLCIQRTGLQNETSGIIQFQGGILDSAELLSHPPLPALVFIVNPSWS